MPKLQEEQIFQVARQIAASQARCLYLEQACGDDAALHARVEALLRVYDQEQSFLESPAEGLQATIDDPIRERPGTLIGSYKLLEQIGEGGFGVVFMAEQMQPVRRKVALKVLKPGMDTRQVVARFEAERQALALMDHPHIAHVFDGGETASGRPYFVMELVKGIPITDFCDHNQLPVPQRLELFLAVCQAVQHAHQKSVIHRDLKPSNVLVTLHDGTPVVKVIDFGIAKALGQQLTDKTLFTGFAQLVGTPLYMSPEQAALSGLDVDTRSDIYALGVLLYELLTGTTPFDGKRLREVGYDELRRILREEEPPKPSTRLSTLGEASQTISTNRRSDPKKLHQLLYGELDWVVMKCLEKDRDRRYQTVLDLAADIRRHLQHEPVLACPPTLRYRLGKFLCKHRGPAVAVAVVWLVLVCGIATTAVAYVQADAAKRAESEQRRAAETARDEAQQAEAEARATADFLTSDMLALLPDMAEVSPATVGETLDAAVPEVDRFLRGQPRVEAAVRHVMGTVYCFLGQKEKALLHLERAAALRRRELGEDHPSTLMSLHNLCTVLHSQGKLDAAESLGQEVLQARRRMRLSRDVWIASSLALLGQIRTDQDRPEQAEPILREALVLYAQALPEGHWRTANAQGVLGGCLVAQSRYEEAEPLLLAACQALHSAPASPRHHNQRAIAQLVRLYEAWGKKEKGEEWRKKLQTRNTVEKR